MGEGIYPEAQQLFAVFPLVVPRVVATVVLVVVAVVVAAIAMQRLVAHTPRGVVNCDVFALSSTTRAATATAKVLL